MAAGQGFKTFTTGEVLTAADVNGYLMQGILVFASAAARDAAITSPQEGQCCYLKDTDAVLTYSGSAWVGFDDSNAIQNSIVNAKGDLIAASANDVPSILPVGTNGQVLTVDLTTATGLKWASSTSPSYTWTSFTPTFTGTSVGNGTVDAKYVLIDKTCHFYISLAKGSTTTIGDTEVTLPVTAASTAAAKGANIMCQFEDIGVGPTNGMVIAVSATVTKIRIGTFTCSGTYPVVAVLSSTVPFTWANGDTIYISGTYEAA